MDRSKVSERVRQIQIDSGLTKTQFANRIATSPDKLSKSLSGTRSFSTTELALVAELAGTTVDWILSGKHPSMPSIAARTALAAPPNQDDIMSVISRYTDAAAQLELLDVQHKLPPLPPLANSSSYVYQGQRLAKDALQMVADAGKSIFTSDFPALLEDVFGIDVAVTNLPSTLDGCAWQSESARLVVVQRTQSWARQRFTLAHELGHILAKDAQQLISEEYPGRTQHSDDVTEKRANAFAAAFLMPESDLQEHSQDLESREDFSRLVARYRVSPSALAWRLLNVVSISDELRREWGSLSTDACLLSVGLTDKVSQELSASAAERLPRRILNHHMVLFHEGQTSARPLANLLNTSSSEVIETFRVGEAV